MKLSQLMKGLDVIDTNGELEIEDVYKRQGFLRPK